MNNGKLDGSIISFRRTLRKALMDPQGQFQVGKKRYVD